MGRETAMVYIAEECRDLGGNQTYTWPYTLEDTSRSKNVMKWGQRLEHSAKF